MNDEKATATAVILPAARTTAPGQTGPSMLPDDLIARSAKQLRVLALVYAFVFFMAAIVPTLIGDDDLWIAATAPAHSLPLATANSGEFGRGNGLRAAQSTKSKTPQDFSLQGLSTVS